MDANSDPTTNNAQAQATQFVLRHLSDAIAVFPPAVRDSLVAKFVAEYDDPRAAELEPVLRKRLTDDEVRHLLFAPTPEQYRFYADLLSLRAPCSSRNDGGDSTTTTTHSPTWQCVQRKRFLTLFYLKHARNWPLVVEFICRDGLQVLAAFFLHEDLQLRGQAIDSFVQLTSSQAFEWFDAPVGYQARVLHAKMIALASPGAGFLQCIVANIRLYDQNETRNETLAAVQRLPGGTFVLLQVLAFFLSWVRKFYTNNELRLSRELLGLLQEWKQRTQSDQPEELQLAQQVYEDFSRWPAIEDTDKDEEPKQEPTTGQHIELQSDTCAASTKWFSPAKVDALIHGDQADDETIEQAISLCSEALDAGLCVAEALLWRANARARRIQIGKASSGSIVTVLDDGMLCLQDCRSVLEHEPISMDAWTCQLTVLETLELWTEGRDLLDAWHHQLRDARKDSFLPQDLAVLNERRAFFDDKAHESQQQQALERRRHATRTAKEQQVVQLLLQRTTVSPAPSLQSKRLHSTSSSSQQNAQPTASSSFPSSDDVLARFRSSATAKGKKTSSSKPKPATDAPLAGVVVARSFVRKFTQCRRDASAIRSLVTATPTDDVLLAMDRALPETSLVVLLGALVAHDEAAEELACVLQHLVEMPRFALLREMAASNQQQTIDRLVDRARAMLGTALAA